MNDLLTTNLINILGVGHPFRLILAFFVSLAVTFFVLPHLAHIANRIGLMDEPGGRKVHRVPKPLIGGLGMVIGLAFSSFLFVPLENLRGFYAGLITLLIIGFFDDFSEINHRWKFVAQVVAAILMIYLSSNVLHSFGNLLGFGAINFGPLAVPVTVFCTVGVINAINMIDGLDGLAGGLSLIAFVSFSILAAMNNQPGLMLLGMAFSGALAAFLRFNWYPSRLFMGDAGSLLLGFALAYFAIAVAQKEGGIVPPVAPLFILALPIVDTVAVMTKRVLKGLSPFHPDKNHLHHILLHLGYCKKDATKVLYGLAIILSVIGILGTVLRIPEYILFLIFVIYASAHALISFRMKRLVRQSLDSPLTGYPAPVRFFVRNLTSRIDYITGLLNNNGLLENLACEYELVRKSDMTLSLVLCDIDNFREVNETYGRTEGDAVLQQMSNVIRESVRRTDIVGRHNGDEFMLILPATTRNGAETLAEKVCSLLSESPDYRVGDRAGELSLSFGIASADKGLTDHNALLLQAQDAIGKSKAAKANGNTR